MVHISLLRVSAGPIPLLSGLWSPRALVVVVHDDPFATPHSRLVGEAGTRQRVGVLIAWAGGVAWVAWGFGGLRI